MQRIKRLTTAWAITLVLCLSGSSLLATSASAQARQLKLSNSQTTRTTATYQRGYPYGYSDGYSMGRSDFRTRQNRDFRVTNDYQRAERGYRSSDGNSADYQAGYRLGYELGYIDGYYGRSYSARMPANALALRAIAEPSAPAVSNVYVPNGLKMTLRLDSTLNTKTNQRGDQFKATVLAPQEFEGASVLGHIAQLNRSGRVTGKTELSLAFDTITLRDGRTGPLRGEVTEVIAGDAVKSVDEEGNIESANKTKDTTIRSGGGAALGAIIGAIAGGGKGAAIGALIGAGVGAGSVYVQGNKDLLLEPGAEMVMETAGPDGRAKRR